MQPQQQRTRARFTSEARERLHEAVKGERERILQATNAVTFDLPREAGGLLAGVVRGYPNYFRWDRVFRHRGAFWRLDCIVSKAGWPDVLWVQDVFASQVTGYQ
jgi:hypothetical protein